jgi:transposase
VAFVGGQRQEQFQRRIRELGADRCVLVGVDVGKHAALALIADGFGQLLAPAVEFALDEVGVDALESAVRDVVVGRQAGLVRFGVEACGHYHRLLLARLRSAGWDSVELAPAQVAAARGQMGYRRLKTDWRDAAAMVEVLLRGGGQPVHPQADAIGQLQAWVAHRQRKHAARVALGNQLLGTVDLVFPGLQGCFTDLLERKGGMFVLRELAGDVDRIGALTPVALRAAAAEHGVRMTADKTVPVIAAARRALRLHEAERLVRLKMLAADLALLDALFAEIAAADTAVEQLLPHTPARVLLSLPGVGAVRAGAYAAALGDPARFPTAEHAYRASGLVPSQADSAGVRRRGRIGREGSAPLRDAMIDIGRGLAQHDEHFAAYRRQLLARGKRPKVAAVAVGHRAHRLAFALMRSQTHYDPARFAQAVTDHGERRSSAAGRPVRSRRAAVANDVTCPPPATVPAIAPPGKTLTPV